MGMFDYIKCEYPLPDTEAQDSDFQTKDLDCTMAQYTITREGKLIHHTTRMEVVPEEERPFYGTPRWDGPLGQLYGSMKAIPTGDVDLDYHGDLVFYDDNIYKARFTNGTVEWIRRVES